MLPSLYAPVAWHDGYCVSCDDEQPLVVTEHGPRGLRAWLAGVGREDRTLSYTCRVCGQCEQVPLTEAEDDAYGATLLCWPDWTPQAVPVAATVVALPAPRRPQVRVVTLPVQRVHATDLGLVLAVA
jgi:hypothetical protein